MKIIVSNACSIPTHPRINSSEAEVLFGVLVLLSGINVVKLKLGLIPERFGCRRWALVAHSEVVPVLSHYGPMLILSGSSLTQWVQHEQPRNVMVELLELWQHFTEQVFEDEPPHPPAVACLILNAVCFQMLGCFSSWPW